MKLITAIILSLLTVFSLNNCDSRKHEEETAVIVQEDIEEAVARGAEDIIEISIRYSGMTRTSAYSYSIEFRESEVLFSCYYFDDDFNEISLEEVPIDSSYMGKVREIAEKHGFINMKYREPNNLELEVRDAPMYFLDMYFPKVVNGRTYKDALCLNYHPSGTEELLKLFAELSDACTDSSGT